MSIIGLFQHADIVVKSIMIGLLLASIVCWALIFEKAFRIWRLNREIKRLEKLMLESARNLEFEKAARLRDQLAVLKEQVFGANGNGNVVPFVADRAA